MRSVDFDPDRKDGVEIDAYTGVHARCALGQQQADPAMQQTERLTRRIGDRHAETKRFCGNRSAPYSQRLERRMWNNAFEINDRSRLLFSHQCRCERLLTAMFADFPSAKARLHWHSDRAETQDKRLSRL